VLHRLLELWNVVVLLLLKVIWTLS
jgi:hypothetical protein